MQSAELRKRFLSFFEKAHGHTVVTSDGLIPSGDPTVLFTSAGMNQFKDCFLGKRTDLTRAASCQKCLRAGDLEEVGKSASHHSFFEMLGNFSFGDYFKEEAIAWGWEFLTGTLDYAGKQPSPHRNLCLSLPSEKLWVSIYEEDEEAFQLWRTLGVPEHRIKRFGQADNFWPANAPTAGPNGPCGPCSELYYDADGQVRGPKSVEVWNLVFTQFDRQSDGSLKPLPRKNIDTGMGLERLTRVIQGAETDYETDLFAPIMKAIRALGQGEKVRLDRVLFAERTIADHIRAIVFLIAEGLVPSNESRGYVLRMLIRRAYRLGRTDLNLYTSTTRTFLTSLVESVEEAMRGSPYSAMLEKQRDVIRRAIRHEEMQFVVTLEAGTTRLEELIASARGKTIAGDEAFKLYDTYGFPLELTVDIAQERGFTVERAGFDAAMKTQQERSRAASQFGGGVFVTPKIPPLMKFHVAKPFVGYKEREFDTKIKGIWNKSKWVEKADAGEEIGVVLEQTPFYGESGGQAGDRGVIEAPQGILDILDTQWVDDLLVHYAKVRTGSIQKEQPVRAKVDPERRLKIERSHTAAHMLHWALRKILGPEAVQAGSFVEAERVRFDFSSLQGLREEQRHEVEGLVNKRVALADEVRTKEMPLDEAKRAGALALFGEKYGATVRVVAIGDYSQELCGGTHVGHTGFVGTFTIVGESSIAAGTRRIEALVGDAAAQRLHEHTRFLQEVARRLGRPAHEVVAGLEELLEQLKQAERGRKHAQTALAKVQAKALLAEGKNIEGVTVISATINNADREVLASMADAITRSFSKDQDGIALLASSGPSSVSLVMATTDGLVRRVHAGELLKEITPLVKGSGGGRPEFAQAGGKDPSGIPAAMKHAEELIREALSRK